MAWGSHCPKCGLPDCAWLAGPYCEGGERIKAFKQFAPSYRVKWPWGLRWLARRISAQMVELEGINDYWCKIAKKEFDDIRLVDVHVKPDEFHMLLRSGVGGILLSWMLQAIRSIGAKAYVEVMGEHPKEGRLVITVARMSGEAPGQRAHRYENIIRSYVTPRPIADWNEACGPCLFWTLDEKGEPIETPYSGTPTDVKPMQVAVTKVTMDGEIVDGTGQVQSVEAYPFPAHANYFTRLPEASLNWKPPEAPPVNVGSI